jgi:hypothetical protein
MNENQRFPQKLFYLMSGIEALIAFFYLVSIPTDPKNIIFLGLSLNRLIMLFLMFIIIGISGINLIKLKNKPGSPNWIEKTRLFFQKYYFLYPIIIFICWVIIFFPAYRFGKYEVIYSRIQPLLILFSLIFFQFLIFLKIKIRRTKNEFLKSINWKVFVFFSIVVLIVWIFLITTRIGLDIDHDFWGGAATPILPLVLCISLFVPFYLLFITTQNESQKDKINWIIKYFPLFLFFFAVIIWNLEPFTPHFFAPKVRPPNYEYYPYSDAQIYDMTAQSLLSGEGYMNRGFVQRPLYGFMLFIFHNIVGQKYLAVVFLQTILYAFFPVLMFYLGKKLFSPFIGISLGVLSVLRELTAFQASAFMEIVHSKLYMTDNWASFFGLLITILVIIWFMKKKENHLVLVLIGATMGISLLMRLNLLLIFIPVFATAFLKNIKNFKTRVLRIGILGLSTFIILLPWMFRNYYQIGEFGVEPQKFRMVIETRFDIEEDPGSSESGSTKPSQMVMPENKRNNYLNKIDTNSVLNILRFTTANFLHNEIHSVLIFPNSIFAESIRGVIENNDFIQEGWLGEINLRQFIAIIINLLFIGLGISISYKKFGWFGLFPLSIHLFYNLSNGLARVSGWRYVIVTDWVVILYYMVGIIFILHMLLQKIGLSNISANIMLDHEKGLISDQEKPTRERPIILSSIILVALIAIGMVLPELLIGKKYQGEITKEEFLHLITINGLDFEQGKLEKYIQDPNLVYISSKAFYPRFFYPGEGEPGFNIEWMLGKEYGQMTFMIVSPFITGVTLEQANPPNVFPHDTEVYIIGKMVESKYGNYFNAELIYLPEYDAQIQSENVITNQ